MIVMLAVSILLGLCRLPMHVIAGPFFLGLTSAAAFVSQAVGRRLGRFAGACCAVVLAFGVVMLFGVYTTLTWGRM